MASISVTATVESAQWEKVASLVTEHEIGEQDSSSSSTATTPQSLDLQQQQQRYLVASPYTTQEHLLDLETLDVENQILSQALLELKAVRNDYSTAPYGESFNWKDVIQRVRELAAERGHGFKETSWYIVAFRSQIKPTTAYPDLGALDKAAHAEAMASGGFLKYWFGSPNQDLRNLATCIWRSHDDARKGSVGPEHRKAAMAARSMYSEWKIDQHRLVIGENVSEWRIDWWAKP